MAKTLEFFFDYGSPTSYLAHVQLAGIAERTGAAVVCRPMLLGGVFKATGNQTPVAIPAKGAYMLADMTRMAAHLGVPIVATKGGGTPEIVRDGETGLLIPPDSPDELVAALQRLQSDSALRRRLAASGRKAVGSPFGRVAKETEQVLLETTQ